MGPYGVQEAASAAFGVTEAQVDSVVIPVKLCNLPPFHAVAARIASVPDDSLMSVKEIASIVGADPALAAEVLFLANSSLFGFPARIPTLNHAIAVLGLDRVKSLACAVAMRALARGSSPFLRPCWRHCVACSVIAAEIAPAFGCSAERASVAGLLHDVGRFGFLRSYATEFAHVLAREYTCPGEVLCAEREALNSDHQSAGAWLIEYWALPQLFAETCEHHHAPVAEHDSPLLKVIKVACLLAEAAGFSVVRYTSPVSYQDVIQSLPEFLNLDAIPSEEELVAKVNKRLHVFEA